MHLSAPSLYADKSETTIGALAGDTSLDACSLPSIGETLRLAVSSLFAISAGFAVESFSIVDLFGDCFFCCSFGSSGLGLALRLRTIPARMDFCDGRDDTTFTDLGFAVSALIFCE